MTWLESLPTGFNLPPLQPGQALTYTIDVPGAEKGDFCMVGTEADVLTEGATLGVSLTGLAGFNKVRLTIANNGTTPVDPGTATYYARVMKREETP